MSSSTANGSPVSASIRLPESILAKRTPDAMIPLDVLHLLPTQSRNCQAIGNLTDRHAMLPRRGGCMLRPEHGDKYNIRPYSTCNMSATIIASVRPSALLLSGAIGGNGAPHTTPGLYSTRRCNPTPKLLSRSFSIEEKRTLSRSVETQQHGCRMQRRRTFHSIENTVGRRCEMCSYRFLHAADVCWLLAAVGGARGSLI